MWNFFKSKSKPSMVMVERDGFLVDKKTLENGGLFSMVRSVGAPKRSREDVISAYNTNPWLRAIAAKVSYSTATTLWKIFAVKSARLKQAEKIIDPDQRRKAIRNLNSSEKYIRCKQLQTAKGDARKKLLNRYKKAGELVEIDDHMLLDILNTGNDFMTGLINSRLMQIYIDLVGSAFQIKERGIRGLPTRLWTIPPTWLEKLPDGSDTDYHFRIGSRIVPFAREDVIWFQDPDPTKPYQAGSGVGSAVGDELDIDEYAAKYLKDFFFNSARPDLIITAENLNKDDTERLERAWNNKHQGLFKRFKTHFLNKKVDVKEIKSTFSKDTLELRKAQRDITFQIWGVPPEIMGVIESSNRATIEGADFIYANYVLTPRLEFQRAYWQQDLVPDFDDRIILDYESPVSEDKEFKLNVSKAHPYAFRVDEIRELSDTPELETEDGQMFAVPFNVVLRDSLSSDAANPSTIDEPQIVNNQSVTENSNSNPKGVRLVNKVLTEAQLSILLKEVKAEIIHGRIKSDLINIINNFGADQITSLGVEGIVFDSTPNIDDYVNNVSFSRITGTVNQTTITDLRQQLAVSVNEGESIVTLTQRINDVFSEATNHRARTIARTETVKAANFGSLEGMKQAGIQQKTWLSSRDFVVRTTHNVLEGQTVPINANFISPSGARGPHPGSLGTAAEDVNCRCSMLAEIAFKNFNEEQKVAYWKNFEATRLPYEKKVTANLRKAFDAQRAAVINKLNELLEV